MDRREDFALLIGRILVAALFLPSGVNKLMAFSAFAASLGAKGLPYPTILAGIMIAVEVLGPLALIVGLWPRWTALVLIGFTALTLWLTHRSFGVVLRPRQNVPFYQSLAVIGGLLFYFASGPGGWSRTSLRRG
jgi:putative oxidoreductase